MWCKKKYAAIYQPFSGLTWFSQSSLVFFPHLLMLLCRLCVNSRVFVRPFVCPVDQHLPLAVAWVWAANVSWQLPVPHTGCQSIAAGAWAAAVGSVMVRSKVRSSTQTCFRRKPLEIIGTGFYGPDILPVFQPSVSSHWREHRALMPTLSFFIQYQTRLLLTEWALSLMPVSLILAYCCQSHECATVLQKCFQRQKLISWELLYLVKLQTLFFSFFI